MRKRKIVVTESELINSIQRIVKEQAAMLGFGNMSGLSLGVAKPSDKYRDLRQEDHDSTYNVNYMNQGQANQNMEDWEMGEDYELEEQGLSWNCEGTCKCTTSVFGAGQYQTIQDCENDTNNCCSGKRKPGWEKTKDYMSEGLRNLVRNELLEAQAKEAKKWIQGAVKRPGALRKKLGVKKGDKISLARINQEMRKIKATDTNKKKKGVQGLSKANARTYRQLNLAKTLRGLSKKKHAKESRKWVKK